MIERFTESIKKSSDISLLFETLHFLAFIGENKQFIKIFDVVSLQIKTDKDLYDLLLVTLEFFESTNKHKEIEIVKNLVDIQKEKDLKSGAKFDETIFKNLKNLIELSYV